MVPLEICKLPNMLIYFETFKNTKSNIAKANNNLYKLLFAEDF